MAVCREEGAELIIFIPPVHASYLEMIRAKGGWPRFEQWMRDLTMLLEDREVADGPSIAIWSFVGYHRWSTERVANDPDGELQWFFESSHCTPALGELVLREMLGKSPAQIGRRLTVSNIEQVLLEIGEGRAQYVADYPEEIKWLEGVFREAGYGG